MTAKRDMKCWTWLASSTE